MSNNCEALDKTNISPVRPKTKHSSTPLRAKRKTSRRDQGLVDVHTVSTSTPTAAHRSPRIQRLRQDSPKLLNPGSPSSSFPCSQDGRPDVIWDFTSPKLPKDRPKKKELKVSVQELLDNLNHCQSAECDSTSNQYTQLLESWMSKQNEDFTSDAKETENQRKASKKYVNHRAEDLKKLIESLQKSKNNKSSPSRSNSPDDIHQACDNPLPDQDTSFKNSFIDGSKSEDSSEELWGDIDNSFIVKATQELDKVNIVPTCATAVFSTIPETVPKKGSPVIETRKPPSCEEHATILLHLSNIDWDADEDDEWENGFLMEDDDLSLIPDDVLSGVTANNNNSTSVSAVSKVDGSNKSSNELINNHVTVSVKSDDRSQRLSPQVPVSIVSSKESSISKHFRNGVVHNAGSTSTKSGNDLWLRETELCVPNSELYNSFEDGSFEEESLLCQPEVLSKLDEVESLLSQPKCTPEEIKKKKDEALKRRKKTTQLRKRN